MTEKKKTWSQLSKTGRRKAIAQDAIERIQANRMHMKGNGYFEYSARAKKTIEKMAFDADRDVTGKMAKPEDIEKIMENCGVCALGGLFLSRVARFNQITLEGVGLYCSETARGTVMNIGRKECAEGLEDAFDGVQLDAIEAAYEMNQGMAGQSRVYDGSSTFFVPTQREAELCKKAVAFGRQFRDRSDRMLAICQNIVDHGEFRPEVEYEIVTS